MDEESTSWIRRTKFSHTVCHRIDSSRLASVPVRFRTREIPEFKQRSEGSVGSSKRSEPAKVLVQRNPLTNKQRSVSPVPGSLVPDTFKEARSEKKRFLTPVPRRKEPDKSAEQYSSTNSPDSRPSSAKLTPNSSPRRSISPFRGFGITKIKKNSSWSNYFDNLGGKVTAVETVDEHMIDMSKLMVGGKFAYGAHSRLYHGVYKGEAVALKLMCVPDNDQTGLLATRLEKQFTREVTFLARLHHPNVIKFMAARKQPPVYCIVTEYLSEGSLRAFLHKLEHTALPLQKLIPIALEIARGMEYIHSQGVIHRDLKPENILIDQDFHMKIADFGIACEEVHCDPFADDPGTYRWMAPEMIKHKHYGRKVDVYSFGLMLWEMVSGSIPYEDMSPIVAAFAVVNKNLRPEFPKDCPSAMRALIEQCWSTNPDKRPEFWQLVKVLEEFELSLAHDGTLKLVQNSIWQEEKKGFLHWIHKLNPPPSKSVPKPKFI
ncbi:hypothetical protein vseg_017476 [Gypsophila vaccaria]